MLIFQKILCRFSDVFRGDRTGTLVQNRLILKARSVWAITIFFNMTVYERHYEKRVFHSCLSLWHDYFVKEIHVLWDGVIYQDIQDFSC